MNSLRPKDSELFKTIRWFCEATPQQLYNYADDVFGKGYFNETAGFYYSGPKHNVLAVGHTDYVTPRNKSIPLVDGTRNGIRSIALDDRLGIAMLFILRRFGYKFDILLTDNEEIGESTAQAFDIYHKQDLMNYGWIFEVDRRISSKFASQTDLENRKFQPSVVMYHYHTSPLQKMFEGLGFLVETGSFSDICYLDSAVCSAFNFCAAYDREHTDGCFAHYDDIRTMLSAIGGFFEAHRDSKLLRDLDAEMGAFTRTRGWVDYSFGYRRPISTRFSYEYGGLDRSRMSDVVYTLPVHPGLLTLGSRLGQELSDLYNASDATWTMGDQTPRSPCDLTSDHLPGVLRICFETTDNDSSVVEVSINEDLYVDNYLT